MSKSVPLQMQKYSLIFVLSLGMKIYFYSSGAPSFFLHLHIHKVTFQKWVKASSSFSCIHYQQTCIVQFLTRDAKTRLGISSHFL